MVMGNERNHSGNIRLNFGTMGQTEVADPSEMTEDGPSGIVPGILVRETGC